jgi:HPt (histidine-containing phosphotransfer) domain-containing protein
MQPDIIDAAQLAQLRASMSAENFSVLLTMVGTELEKRLTTLADAWAQRERARIAVEAHTILGLAGNMAMARLAATARSLESLAPDAAEADIGELVTRVIDQAAEAQAALAMSRAT